jgi:hypothetical protein
MLRSLLIVCALCHVAAAQSWTVGEGTVAAPGANVVYVMEQKALTAIDLAKARTKWKADTLVKPMAQVGDALLALDFNGALKVVDVKTGKPRKGCDTIPKVALQLKDGLGSSQSSSGFSDGKRAWISWTIDTFYAGGAAPPPDVEAAARKHSEGTWEVDIATCSAKQAQAPKRGVTPGGITVTVIPDKAIERARGADKLPEIKLTTNMVALSADGAHAFAALQNISGYDVTIIDLDTTKTVATIKLGFLPYSAMLVGGKILVGDGWAFDIVKKKELWRRDLRSLRYDGPYPP